MKKTPMKIIALILVAALLASALSACDFIEKYSNNFDDSTENNTRPFEESVFPSGQPEAGSSLGEEITEPHLHHQLPQEIKPPKGSILTVYFIDVGQADAALLSCDGEFILIDGGNSADSSLIYSFLKQHNAERLKYIICTHPHEDHVGGLAGALNYATVEHALCSKQRYDSKAFESFVKYLSVQGIPLESPTVGDTFLFGNASVTVLAPAHNAEDLNNESIVLYVRHGENSFLFTGDAEREEELDILDGWEDISADVLKVGHHGSASSTTYPFLRAVSPKYAVISAGADNPYGHPDDDTLSRLRDADVTVYRTDEQGTIICESDGISLVFSTERTKDAVVTEKSPQDNQNTSYILNTRSMKFHLPSCSSVDNMSDKNKAEYTGTREELINQGYTPCGNCNP